MPSADVLVTFPTRHIIITILICLHLGSSWGKGQTCVFPPGIEDGHFSPFKEVYNIGESIMYTCDDGFELIGVDKRQCISHNNWSGTSPTCVHYFCGIPGTPLHGFNNFNKSNPSNETIYSCNGGYVLAGEAIRKCTLLTVWSPPQIPKCVSNLAFKKTTSQSIGSPPPSKPHQWVDGNLSTIYTLTSNRPMSREEIWWSVDLERVYDITNVVLHIQIGAKNLNVTVKVANNTQDKFNTAHVVGGVSIPHASAVLPINVTSKARFVFLQSTNPIPASEIDVFNKYENVKCGTPDGPRNGDIRSLWGSDSFEYSCKSNYILRISGGQTAKVTCANGDWSGRPPTCIHVPPITTARPFTTTTRPLITFSGSRTPTTPKSPNTPAPTKSNDDADKVTGYVGIMGIAMGAVAASLAIIIAVVVVVCVMKKYYKNKHHGVPPPPCSSSLYTSPQDYRLDSHSSASRSYDGSQRGPSVHLYDSIKDPPGYLLPRHPNPVDVSNCIMNEGYGIKYSPLSNRRYEQLLTAHRPTPVYDDVHEGEEGIPMTSTSSTLPWDSNDPDADSVRNNSLYISGAPRTTL